MLRVAAFSPASACPFGRYMLPLWPDSVNLLPDLMELENRKMSPDCGVNSRISSTCWPMNKAILHMVAMYRACYLRLQSGSRLSKIPVHAGCGFVAYYTPNAVNN